MAESAVSYVLRKLGDLLLHEAHLLHGARREFEGLQTELKRIQCFLKDTDSMQKDAGVRVWVYEIRDVAYDVEDLIDTFILKITYWNRKGFIKRYVSIFKYPSDVHSVATEIQSIKGRLLDISRNGETYGIRKDISRSGETYGIRNIGEGMSLTSSERLRDLRRSSPRGLEKDIVGFEEDTKILVAQLVKKEDRQRSVISIVGMGGLGKTTLAKKVYNHGDVRLQFDCRAWVYVSHDCRSRDILQKILRQLSYTQVKELQRLQEKELEAMVYEILEAKRYLVVLDDICTKEAWDCLARAFPYTSNGSRLLLTTRSREVCLHADARSIPHQLKFMSNEDSWELFCREAIFKHSTLDTISCPSGLEDVGREIVAICGGLPLAIILIGGLLWWRGRARSEWQRVLCNLIEWQRVFGNVRSDFTTTGAASILDLSYNAMPSYLQQCLAFCLIFPKGYEFSNIQLIQFWMTRGLLQPSTGNQDPEAIGQLYIEQLLSTSFFQEVEEKAPLFMFKLNDFIHDLASSVIETYSCKINSQTSYILNSQTSSYTFKRVRHLTFSENNSSNDVYSILLPTQNHVRSIFFPVEGVGPTSESFIETCISRFEFLQVLDLSDSCLEVLPSSIGELKYLGYLDLSRSRTLRKLPDSIYELPNLQTLGLLGCLELEELPRGKGNFTSLRSLSLTTKQMLLPEKKIGGLKFLRFLVIGEWDNLKSLGKVLRHLTALRVLTIRGCGSLKRLPRSIKHLTALETLHISDCGKLNLMKWREDIAGLKLRLRSVSIGQLQQSMVLPLWLRTAANTLEHIRIEDCPNLIALPEWLPNLTCLEKLEIINCPELVALPAGMQSLTELRVKVEDCPKLRRASAQETGEDFPKITFLEETSEVVEIIRSKRNFVVSKREIDSTSKGSRSMEGSWWNLDLF